MHTKPYSRAVLLSFIVFSNSVTAHTWIEQLNVIAANGTMVGAAGFPRGNVLRSNPSFSDTAMVQLIPPNGGPVNVIDPSQLMCKPGQTAQTQTNASPRLSAAPGASVALRYQENGHVTLQQNQPGKPANGGTNFVYYTTQSQPTDKFLDIHRSWTVDGSGGDGRGRLISTQPFDDGQCYQVNGGSKSQQRQSQFKHAANSLMGADLWCQQDIQIPSDALVGSTITLYWVWDWPTMPGTAGFPNGKQEIYTTCMDIDIVAGSSSNNKQAAVQQFVQQDVANAAVSSQFVNIANPTAVASPETIAFAGASGSVSAGKGSPAATPATSSTKAVGQSPTTPLSPVAASSTPLASNGLPVTTTAIVPFSSQGRPSGHYSGHSNGGHHGGPGATFTVYQTDLITATSTAPIATKPGQSCNSPRAIFGPFFNTTVIILPQSDTLTPPTAVVIPNATAVVTVLETDMLTITMTNTVNPKRGITDSSDVVTTLTSTGDAAAESSTACSKTESVYRLRARLPFYILPDDDKPSAGC